MIRGLALNLFCDMRILAFGSFDPLHEGHRDFLHQAKALGTHLTVVVAPNEAIATNKGYTPFSSLEDRIEAVKALKIADTVLPGTTTADPYQLLRDLAFDVIAIGYDQLPNDEIIRRELDVRGKQQVQILRLQPFHPEKYKSSFIRKGRSDSV